ncbi:MAG: hypothetical protein KGL45_08925 [Gammaproteobacteria bacterium]|nr:hypothetical protein [Gammaproteobacteria bacterium]
MSFFEPGELHAQLAAMGLCEAEDIPAMQLVARYLSIAAAAPPRRGAHVLRAGTR